MNNSRIPVKLDRNTFRSNTELGFRPVEKADHQGCCGQIPSESGRNRNPAQDSGPQKTGMKTGIRRVLWRESASERRCRRRDDSSSSLGLGRGYCSHPPLGPSLLAENWGEGEGGVTSNVGISISFRLLSQNAFCDAFRDAECFQEASLVGSEGVCPECSSRMRCRPGRGGLDRGGGGAPATTHPPPDYNHPRRRRPPPPASCHPPRRVRGTSPTPPTPPIPCHRRHHRGSKTSSPSLIGGVGADRICSRTRHLRLRHGSCRRRCRRTDRRRDSGGCGG